MFNRSKKISKAFISISDAMRLITSTNDKGHVLFECRGLSPVEVIVPNIQEVRIMVQDAAKTNDEIYTFLNGKEENNDSN